MKTREQILAEIREKFPKTTEAPKASLEDVVQAVVVHAANSAESAEITVPDAVPSSTLGDWIKTHAPIQSDPSRILTTKAEFVKEFNTVQFSGPELDAFIHDLGHIVFIAQSLVTLLKKGQSC